MRPNINTNHCVCNTYSHSRIIALETHNNRLTKCLGSNQCLHVTYFYTISMPSQPAYVVQQIPSVLCWSLYDVTHWSAVWRPWMMVPMTRFISPKSTWEALNVSVIKCKVGTKKSISKCHRRHTLKTEITPHWRILILHHHWDILNAEKHEMPNYNCILSKIFSLPTFGPTVKCFDND